MNLNMKSRVYYVLIIMKTEKDIKIAQSARGSKPLRLHH